MTEGGRVNKNAKHKFDVLYKTWLERMVLSKTFDDDPLELEKDIQRIKTMLDEDDVQQEQVNA